ncbi:MAG: hypothetical protein GY870_17945 [archaeon]|nr:hypothetical protein [archaeon]
MTYIKFIIFSLFCIALFCGCGLKETVVQKEKISYLSFTGNISNAIIHIDDLEPISLKNSKNVHYEISTGKHHIVVTKNGEEVVNRIVLLGSGSVKEIKIP